MGRLRFIFYTSLKRKKTEKEGGRIRWKDASRKWGNWRIGRSCGQQEFQYDEYRLKPQEYVLYAAIGTGFGALSAYIFYRSLIVFLLLSPAGLFYPIMMKKELKERRLRKLNVEFKEGILILSSFLSAGYSVENAFAASVKELTLLYGRDGMITKEFAHMGNQMKMNRPVEQVLMEFANRSGLDDVKNFAEVFQAAKRSGGELVSIINHTTGVIRDKIQVQEEIITLTASRQFEQKIMNMIPFFIVFYIDMTSPGFFDIMYSTGVGRILMTVCLGVYLAAYVLAGRMMKIEV